ncbi:MAG: arsenic transporter [Caulobacteraceae bacterium]|nr:arsenic transporter [Caulobacteraceae bacterium]
MTPFLSHLLTWTIAGAATAGVITRPFRWPEAVWALGGAFLLVGLGLLPLADGLRAVGKGTDVYLFLVGMMLLSETARREGLFDVAAARAVNLAGGSSGRLFLLIYGVGTLVTVFLSNDATAVVLTPAVYAAARHAKADPLPHLFACALIANAASFVLPISNPANLVLYGDHLPPLIDWLKRFAPPSLLAVGVTFAALRWAERRSLSGACASGVEQPRLSAGGWSVLVGIGVTAGALLTVSALGRPLGLATFILGALTTFAVLVRGRSSPWPILRGVSWGVLPLVAGLFVLVEALGHSGVIAALADALRHAAAVSPTGAGAWAGGLVAVSGNLMNNLPAGLVASATLNQAHAPGVVVDAMLIGVDLGPNLSITGSLATILWLAAIRREGEAVGFWRFFKVGVVVMPPALIASLGARLWLG